MGNPQHLEWLLEGVEAWNARRLREPFVPDLSGMNVRGEFDWIFDRKRFNAPALNKIDLSGANLTRANLELIDFRNSNFENSNLTQCTLIFSDLAGSNLRKVIFDGANMLRTHLVSSDSRGASFRFANLVNASLSNAKLNGANFDGAMLRGAELSDADVRSFIDRTAGGRLVITDLSKAKWLQQHAVDEMIGDKATVLPARLSRPAHWGEVDVDLTPPDATKGPEALADLDAPLVRASSVDFKFTEAGIEARLSEAQAIHPPELAGDCGLRRDALIANARDIATTINNQLAIDARHDLESYAAHLETADPANPYRLNFIATGLQGDLEDDFKSGGFDKRLRKRLESFLNEHGAFLSECAPAAAEAIRIKTEAQLAEVISKERATEMLATLTAAIEATENAAHSATKMLDDLKAHDAVMNAHKVKLYAAQEVTRFEASVQAEAKELISITSRLYFRAKEVLEVARPKTVQDVAAYTVVGDVAQAGAKIIIEHLTPMMQWFAKLLS